MNFETWEPIYDAILTDMGYDREADERARDLLRSLVGTHSTISPADYSCAGDVVAIAGPRVDGEADWARLREADRTIAAGRAADHLVGADEPVDWVVTDLDGHERPLGDFTARGIPVAVHAHGDNIPRLRETLPNADLSFVLPTTQAAPVGPVCNFGGFTDGDRAAFLADTLGAARLTFPGWRLDDGSVSPEKRRKLEWAARLLRWLERHRDERFDLLDGRRDAIDESDSLGLV